MDPVVVILVSPLLLLAANFVFGRCGVADGLDRRIDGRGVPVGAKRASSARRGKLLLIAVVGVFIWHCVEVLVSFRIFEGRPLHECSVPFTVWYAVDRLTSRLSQLPPLLTETHAVHQLLQCGLFDVVHGSLCASFMVLFAFCVFTRVQVAPPVAGHRAATTPSTVVSWCSKCDAHVEVMDHHCYFVHNCIGAANRKAFVGLLATTWSLTSLLLIRCSGWYSDASAANVRVYAAAAVTVVVMLGSMCLCMWQCYLLRSGETTLSYLKRRQRQEAGCDDGSGRRV